VFKRRSKRRSFEEALEVYDSELGLYAKEDALIAVHIREILHLFSSYFGQHALELMEPR
jgi:hypothetical protein